MKNTPNLIAELSFSEKTNVSIKLTSIANLFDAMDNEVIQSFSPYGGNEVLFIETNNPLEKISHLDSSSLCICFENRSYPERNLYLVLSEVFLKKNILEKVTESNIISLKGLEELLLHNDLVISYLRYECACFLDKKNTDFSDKLFLTKWISELILNLAVFFNHSVLAESELFANKFEVDSIIGLEATISQKLELATPNVSQMASSVNMSQSKFKLLFKQIFKESPHQHFLDKKFRKAFEMLQAKEYSVSQVAYRLGFSHPSALTRLFRSKLGQTPTGFFEFRGEEESSRFSS